MSIKSCRERINDLLQEKDGILNSAAIEVRAVTVEERDNVKNINDEVRSIEELIQLNEEARFDDSLKVGVEIENSKEEAIENQLHDFLARGYIGEELRSYTNADMNLTTDTGVGVIIPTKLSNFIIEKMGEFSSAFSEATKLPSVTGKFSITIENETDDKASIVAEGAAFEDFKKLAFKARKMDQLRLVAGYVLTQQMINNSEYSLVPLCLEKLALKMARKAEFEIFQGAGTEADISKGFRGLTGADADSGITEVGNATKDTWILDDFNKAYNALHPSYLPKAKWYMTRKLYNIASKLKDTNGHYYLQNGIVNGKPVHTLFGAPIEISQLIGDACPVFFGSMKDTYCIMIKKGLELKQISDDTTNAVQATHTLLLDMYCDGTILNGQAMVRVKAKTS